MSLQHQDPTQDQPPPPIPPPRNPTARIRYLMGQNKRVLSINITDNSEMFLYSCFPQYMMAQFDGGFNMETANSKTSLARIAFVNIHGLYWRGRYGENEVILRQGDCFVNATKLCQYYEKDFGTWREYAEDLISFVELEMRNEHFLFSPYLPKSDFKAIDSVLTFSQFDYDGIYIHPFLLPHLMSWLSQTFAIFTGKVVNQYLSNSYIESFESIKKSATERASAKIISTIKKEVATASDDEVEQPVRKRVKAESMREKVRGWEKTTHCFAILNVNDSAKEFQYYTIRCKRRAMNPAIRKIKKRHPAATLAYLQKYVSNERNLFDTLKKMQKVISKLNYFIFPGSLAGLIEDIREFSEPVTTKESVSDDTVYVLDSVKPPT